jgi:AraC-like DNA-binding protein
VREVGLTPHRYIVQLRVERARKLLRQGETPAAVAAAAGFTDQSHMTRAFARQFGVSPARYRAAVL